MRPVAARVPRAAFCFCTNSGYRSRGWPDAAPHDPMTMTDASHPGPLAHDVARRRTFAIISHPDAGKTTLTEKLLLYGGAIRQAGAVKAKTNQKNTTSDWMALERKRGI